MAFFRGKSAGTVPALFLHIQKTAGTSIIHLARQYYGDSLVSHGDCWGKSCEQLSRFRFVSGHVGYDFARHLMPGRYSFTFLRDPVERILSMYYFCRTRNPDEFDIYKKAHEMDLPEFLEAGFHDPCVRKNIWNNQVWQLAHGYAHLDGRGITDFGESELLRLAKAHIGEFSHVGFTETFLADSLPILKALRLPRVSEMPRVNETVGRSKDTKFPAAIREKLERLTELDRQLYDYARNDLPLLKRSLRPSGWHR